MFEDERMTRAAICGAGILLALIFLVAHLPLLLLIVPVGILFLGLVADPYETHAVWYGILNVLGIFDLSALTDSERLTYREKRHYFWFGEVGMAAILAGVFAVPAGIYLAGRTEMTLAFIGAAVIFLPLFVFLPKLIQRGLHADVDAAIDAFGKNEQTKKVFWSVFAAVAGLVLAQVLDPGMAKEVVGMIMGVRVNSKDNLSLYFNGLSHEADTILFHKGIACSFFSSSRYRMLHGYEQKDTTI